MGRGPGSLTAGGLTVGQRLIDNRLAVTLTGRLDLDCVEHLAACADQICRASVGSAGVGSAVFDVSGLAAVDDAGARTLVAACQCLSSHGILAEVRGVGSQLRQALDRLDLTVPEAGEDAVRAVTVPQIVLA